MKLFHLIRSNNNVSVSLMSVKGVCLMVAAILGVCFAEEISGNNEVSQRVINGTWAKPGEFPYVVYLSTGCTGSIISPSWVLTAAHCYDDPTLVYAGTVDHSVNTAWTQTSRAVQFIIHPKYIEDENYNKRELWPFDIALVQVKKPFVFNAFVKPIAIVGSGFSKDSVLDCKAAGYGLIYGTEPTTKLYYTEMVTNAESQCSKFLKFITDSVERLICTIPKKSGTDTCNGDSGGPLVCNDLLFSVLIWGPEICGESSSTPTIYESATYYLPWIQEHVKDLVPPQKLQESSKVARKP